MKPSGRFWYYVRSLVTLMTVVGCAAKESEETVDAQITSLVTGDWVEVYPRWDDGLILAIRADSTAAGTFFDADGAGGGRPASAWKIGSRAMPAGLCIRFGEEYSCQGFVVRGDSLFLADLRRTVLVRAAAVKRGERYIPRRSARAPVPGDSGFRSSAP